jgi:SPP1 gp7 family putative phage head morphogenesis protein
MAKSKSPEQLDPQRLQGIRNPLVKQIDQKYKALSKAIYQKLVKENFLESLKPPKHTIKTIDTQKVTVRSATHAYNYPTASSSKQEFLTWLEQQLQEGTITDKQGKPITVTTDLKDAVYSAYKQGTLRAYIDAHKPPKHGPKSDAQYIDGQKEQFLQDAFNAPANLETMELIASRAFDQMDGIDSNMSKQMSRIFAEAVLKGENPRKVAAKLIKEVGMTATRARTVARTEMAFAFAEGQLSSFEKQGIEEVGVLVEYSTAEDEKVCPKCAPYNNQVFKIKDAHGLIPMHPNCRCAWIPPAYNPNATYKMTGDEVTDQLAKVEVEVKRTPPYVQQSPDNQETFQQKFLDISVPQQTTDALQTIALDNWKQTPQFQTQEESLDWLKSNVINHNPIPQDQEPTRLHIPVAIILEGNAIPLLLGGKEYLHRGNILETTQQIPGQILYGNDQWTPDAGQWQFRILIPKGMPIYASPDTPTIVLPAKTRIEINEVNNTIVKGTIVRKPTKTIIIGTPNPKTKEVDNDFTAAFDNAKNNLALVTNSLTLDTPPPQPIFVPPIMVGDMVSVYDQSTNTIIIANDIVSEDVIEQGYTHEALKYIGENGKLKHTNTLLNTIASEFHKNNSTIITPYKDATIAPLIFKVSNPYSQTVYKIDSTLPDTPNNFLYGKDLIPTELPVYLTNKEAYQRKYPEMGDFLSKVLSGNVKNIDTFEGVKLSKLENNTDITDDHIVNELNTLISQTPQFQLETVNTKTQWHNTVNIAPADTPVLDTTYIKQWNNPLNEQSNSKPYTKQLVKTLFRNPDQPQDGEKTTLSQPIALTITGYDALPLTFGGILYMEKGNIVQTTAKLPAKVYYTDQSIPLAEEQWQVIIQVPQNTPLYLQSAKEDVVIPANTRFLINDRKNTTVYMTITDAKPSIINLPDNIKAQYIRAQEAYSAMAEAFDNPPDFTPPTIVSKNMMKGFTNDDAAGIFIFNKTWVSETTLTPTPDGKTFGGTVLHESLHKLAGHTLKGTNTTLDDLCSYFHRTNGTEYEKKDNVAYWLFPFTYYAKYCQRIYPLTTASKNVSKAAMFTSHWFGKELFTAESAGITKFGFDQYKEKHPELGAFFETIFNGNAKTLQGFDETQTGSKLAPLPPDITISMPWQDLVNACPNTPLKEKLLKLPYEYRNKDALLTTIKNSKAAPEWKSILIQKANQLAPSGEAVINWTTIDNVISKLPKYDRIACVFALEQNTPFDLWLIESFAKQPFQAKPWYKQIDTEIKQLKDKYNVVGIFNKLNTAEQIKQRKVLDEAVKQQVSETDFRNLLSQYIFGQPIEYVPTVPTPVPDTPKGKPPHAPIVALPDYGHANNGVLVQWAAYSEDIEIRIAYAVENTKKWTKIEITDNSTWHAIKDMIPGTTYDINVMAKNAYGMSDIVKLKYSTPKIANTPPEQFNIVITNIAETTVTIQWPNVGTSYEVSYRLESEDAWTIAVSDYTFTAFTIEGLTPDTAYKVDVTAYNDAGDTAAVSTFKTAISLQPTISRNAPPAPITGFIEDDHTATTVELQWDIDPNVTEYVVIFKEPGMVNWKSINIVYSKGMASVSSLKPNTIYKFQLKAKNNRGLETAIIEVQTDADEKQAPQPITGLHSTFQSDTVIKLAWDNDPSVTMYGLNYQNLSNNIWKLHDVWNKDGRNATTVSNLKPDTEYRFLLRAINDYGESPAYITIQTQSETQVQPDAATPKEITGLYVHYISTSAVEMKWDFDPNVTTYKVYYKENKPHLVWQFHDVLENKEGNNEVMVTGLQPNTDYVFKIIAYYGGGEALEFDEAPEIVATTQEKRSSPTGKPILTVLPYGDAGDVYLSWTKVPKAIWYSIYVEEIPSLTGGHLYTKTSANADVWPIKNLKPNTEYKFSVVPFGEGLTILDYTATISYTTPDFKPAAKQNEFTLSVQPYRGNVMLSWTPVPNAIAYTIGTKEIGVDETPQYYTDADAKATGWIIQDLKPNTEYDLSVIAKGKSAYRPNATTILADDKINYKTSNVPSITTPKGTPQPVSPTIQVSGNSKWQADYDKAWATVKKQIEQLPAKKTGKQTDKEKRRFLQSITEAVETQNAQKLHDTAKEHGFPHFVKSAKIILQLEAAAPTMQVDRRLNLSLGFEPHYTPPIGKPTVKQLAGGYSGSSASKLVYPNGDVIVRKSPGNKKHMEVELLASQIYSICHIPAPQMQTDGDSIYYPYNADAAPKPSAKWTNENYKALADHAIVGLLIDNRDWIGENNDNNNILWDKSDNPFAIDHGSAFEFRATGPLKDEKYDSNPANIEQKFIRAAQKGQARKTISQLTESELKYHCNQVAQRFTPATFEALKKKFPNNTKNIDALQAHVQYYADIGSGKRPIPKQVLERLTKETTQEASKEFHLAPKDYKPLPPTDVDTWVKKSTLISDQKMQAMARKTFNKYKTGEDVTPDGKKAYKAMKAYTANGYSVANRAFANRRIENDYSITPLDPNFEYAKYYQNYANADTLFNVPAPQDMVLRRRGIVLPDEKNNNNKEFWKYVPDNIYTTFQPGTEWNVFTWISTSLKWISINRYEPANHIYIPKGMPIMPVGTFSSNSGEQEVILSPMTRFRVLSLKWQPATQSQKHYSGVDNGGQRVILSETHLLLVYKSHDPMK